MEEKKLIPKRRFEGFNKNLNKEILKNLGSFGKTYSFSRSREGDGIYHHIHYGDIHTKNFGIIHEDTEVPAITEMNHFETVKKGDIVIADASEDYNDLGKVVVIGELKKKKVIAGLHTFKFTPNSKLLSEYFLYYSQTNYYRKFSAKIGTGISVFGISKENLSKLNLNLPNHDEQQKIGKFFRVLDERIANQERKIAKVKALKEAYLAEMFPQEGETVPKRRFKGFKGEWRKTSLGELGYTYSGMSGKTKKDFGHGEAEFITYLNVFNNPISKETGLKKVVLDTKEITLKYGDILFTTSSETPHEVGMSSVWLFNKENVYLNSFCFGFRPSIKIDSYFIAFFLRTNRFRKRITVLAQGISRYNISKNKVMDIEILLPNIKEQQKIGAFFKNLDDQIEAEEAKLEKLKQMKEAYLEEMFV